MIPVAANHNMKLQTNRGFTLIELLLYVSIIGAMILSVSSLLPLLMQSRVKNQTIAEVEQQGAQVMQVVTQTVRNAATLNSPTQGLSASSLSINVVDSAKSPTIFDLSGGVIRMQEGAGSPVSLTNSHVVASGLTLQNLSRTGTKGTIKIQFTITQINPEGRQEYNFNKIFYGTATVRQ